MSAEENKSIHRRRMEEINKKNQAFLSGYFGPGYVYHGPAGDLDRETFIRVNNAMLAAFPDVHVTISDQVSEGDMVVTRWQGRGTHQGELQGIAPTGRQVMLRGILISRIEGGKAAEEWEEIDLLGLMQQLGVVPSMGQSGN